MTKIASRGVLPETCCTWDIVYQETATVLTTGTEENACDAGDADESELTAWPDFEKFAP